MWVRQGRTDAWISHKLDVSIDQLERFKRDHDLEAEVAVAGRPADPLSVPPPDEEDLYDMQQQEAAELHAQEPYVEEPEEDEPEDDEEDEPAAARPPRPRREGGRPRGGARPPRQSAPREGRDAESDDAEGDGAQRPRRRRGRRGGRGRRRPGTFEATFDHGEEGYGLWLDPAVVDNPVYAEHWAGHRAVVVSFDRDSITIRRANGAEPGAPEEPEGAEAEDQ